MRDRVSIMQQQCTKDGDSKKKDQFQCIKMIYKHLCGNVTLPILLNAYMYVPIKGDELIFFVQSYVVLIH